MMVKEKRLLLEPGDITHLRLTCERCNGATLCTLKSEQAAPLACPHCGTPWRRSGNSAIGDPVASQLLQMLRQAANHDGLQVKMQLEALDEDS